MFQSPRDIEDGGLFDYVFFVLVAKKELNFRIESPNKVRKRRPQKDQVFIDV
jgi:hypothetical protein